MKTNNIKSKKSKWLIISAIIAVFAIAGGTIWGIWRATDAAAYTLSENQALQLAYQHAGINEDDIVTKKIHRDRENGIHCYEVDFTTASHSYDYDINGEDGSIVHSSYKTLPGYTNQVTVSVEEQIDQESAKSIALQDAGVSESDTNYLRVKQEMDDGISYFEVEFGVDGISYDYEISCASGEILSCNHDLDDHQHGHFQNTQNTSDSKTVLSYDEAKALVLGRVEGATDSYLKMELEKDNGRYIYEGELYYQGAEYEFEMDASTGNFIKWSVDYED